MHGRFHGLYAHSAGLPYPPVRHPDDHHFVWEKGRTLQAYQFALISEGRGQLQSAPYPEHIHKVKAGDVFLLFPGIWHRFSPDPMTGWVENWIECRGTAFDQVMGMGLNLVNAPIWSAGPDAAEIFNTVHRLAREDALLHQPTLSTPGLQLLALLCQSRAGRARPGPPCRTGPPQIGGYEWQATIPGRLGSGAWHQLLLPA
ncbi:AraC family ligand binding domain-containing protein [Devosia sp. A8/3-2]|nr:AraC family ligand binding domain-containing protein [Devosia sp. A8/3-2]